MGSGCQKLLFQLSNFWFLGPIKDVCMTFRIVITIHSQTDVIYLFLIYFAPPIEPFATLGRHVDTNIFDFPADKIVYEEDRELKTFVRSKQLRFHY